MKIRLPQTRTGILIVMILIWLVIAPLIVLGRVAMLIHANEGRWPWQPKTEATTPEAPPTDRSSK